MCKDVVSFAQASGFMTLDDSDPPPKSMTAPQEQAVGTVYR